MPRTSTARKPAALSPAKAAQAQPDSSDRFRHFPFPEEHGYVASDALTGHMWSHTLGGSVLHKDAQGRVDVLNAQAFAGHSDWRLPTVEELFLIADRTKRVPAIDTTAFPGTKSDWYWTATPYAGGSGAAWFVSFYLGSAYWSGHGYVAFVRAVRGPVARARQ